MMSRRSKAWGYGPEGKIGALVQGRMSCLSIEQLKMKDYHAFCCCHLIIPSLKCKDIISAGTCYGVCSRKSSSSDWPQSHKELG